MRRAVILVCAALSLSPAADAGTGGTSPGGGGAAARLQGTWTMSAKVTRADGVRGERRGQKFKRKWTFTSSCASGACSSVTLRRERSSGKFDKLTLKRLGSAGYKGSSKFYLPLKCNGRTYNKGGIAYYNLGLSITQSKTVQGKRFASAIRATYNNTRRVNKTPCGGSLGRDGGSYTGAHAAPTPPTADFEFANDSSNPRTVDFADHSTRSSDARFVSWSWDFGDGGKATKKNPTHEYSAPGSYDVTLTVKDTSGLTDTATKTVIVP
jgi:PKD repeat protein